MLAQSLIWIHEWVATGGLLDLLLASDTNLCATIGVLAGCVIGWNQTRDAGGTKRRG